MTLRTKGEQKAYLDGYEMCADCIEKYLTDEGKQKLECLLMAVRDAVEIEDIEPKTDTLDKIRSEIKDIAFDWQEIDGEHESFMIVDLNDALNIIDKYKAESEDK